GGEGGGGGVGERGPGGRGGMEGGGDGKGGGAEGAAAPVEGRQGGAADRTPGGNRQADRHDLPPLSDACSDGRSSTSTSAARSPAAGRRCTASGAPSCRPSEPGPCAASGDPGPPRLRPP